MSSSKRNFCIWIPISLLIINLFLISFLIEELIDASAPNYGGGLGLLTPLTGMISFLYIRRKEGGEANLSLDSAGDELVIHDSPCSGYFDFHGSFYMKDWGEQTDYSKL